MILCAFLLCLGNSAKAQASSGNQFIENCFQKIKLDGGTYNILNTPVNFSWSSTFSGGEFIWLQAFDDLGVEILSNQPTLMYNNLIQSGIYDIYSVTPVYINNGQSYLQPLSYIIDMYDITLGYNTRNFTIPPGAKTFVITLLGEDPNGGNPTYGDENRTTFNVLEDDETVTIHTNEGEDCLTFSNNKIDGDINLDGFCGDVINVLKTPASGIDTSITLIAEMLLGEEIDLESFGDHCDDCLEMAVPYNSSGPFPCGCQYFDLETIIYPCEGKEDCDPITYSREITICCRCDIRSSQPDN